MSEYFKGRKRMGKPTKFNELQKLLYFKTGANYWLLNADGLNSKVAYDIFRLINDGIKSWFENVDCFVIHLDF